MAINIVTWPRPFAKVLLYIDMAQYGLLFSSSGAKLEVISEAYSKFFFSLLQTFFESHAARALCCALKLDP
jgi:hypothetical protein